MTFTALADGDGTDVCLNGLHGVQQITLAQMQLHTGDTVLSHDRFGILEDRVTSGLRHPVTLFIQ